MKICMPVENNNALESMPYNHFGSAPFFLIYDTETKGIKPVNNGDLGHEHGMCQPLKALGQETVDVIIVSGIGAGALNKLASLGIKAYRAENTNFKQNIECLLNNKLPQFALSDGCTAHNCGHHH